MQFSVSRPVSFPGQENQNRQQFECKTRQSDESAHAIAGYLNK
jgi:hypothetical protein